MHIQTDRQPVWLYLHWIQSVDNWTLLGTHIKPKHFCSETTRGVFSAKYLSRLPSGYMQMQGVTTFVWKKNKTKLEVNSIGFVLTPNIRKKCFCMLYLIQTTGCSPMKLISSIHYVKLFNSGNVNFLTGVMTLEIKTMILALQNAVYCWPPSETKVVFAGPKHTSSIK